jgi:hypothetical protein
MRIVVVNEVSRKTAGVVILYFRQYRLLDINTKSSDIANIGGIKYKLPYLTLVEICLEGLRLALRNSLTYGRCLTSTKFTSGRNSSWNISLYPIRLCGIIWFNILVNHYRVFGVHPNNISVGSTYILDFHGHRLCGITTLWG